MQMDAVNAGQFCQKAYAEVNTRVSRSLTLKKSSE